MAKKSKHSDQPRQPETVSVKERIQQLRDRRAAADKIGRKPRG